MTQLKNCPAVLQSYLRYLEVVENVSAATLKARYLDLKGYLQYIRWLAGGGADNADDIHIEDMQAAEVAAVTEDDIDDYLRYLAEVVQLSELTIYRRKRSSLRMFYAYLCRYQEELGISIPANPVPSGKRGECKAETPCRPLTPSEISRVLKAVQGEAALRDIAIILLISTSGLTTSEVVKIRYQDYRDDTLVVAGRKVFLTEACQKAIDHYILEFRDPISEFLKDNTLFVSRNYCRRLTSRGLQRALQKHFDNAGVTATPRDLRYTAVLALLSSARNECERTYIAGCLGYTSKNSLKDFPLPEFQADNTVMPQLLENSWLNDIGRRKEM